MSDIVVPEWDQETDEAVLITWFKAVGDQVAKGEVIAEIEMAKANAELESPFAGTVTELVVAEGTDVVPGQVVARLSND